MDHQRFFDFQSLLELDLASDRDLDGVEQPLAVDIAGCTFRVVDYNPFVVPAEEDNQAFVLSGVEPWGQFDIALDHHPVGRAFVPA